MGLRSILRRPYFVRLRRFADLDAGLNPIEYVWQVLKASDVRFAMSVRVRRKSILGYRVGLARNLSTSSTFLPLSTLPDKLVGLRRGARFGLRSH